MNTEINFLEKKPNRYATFLKLGIVFVFLLLCVLAIILFQKHNYQSQFETQSKLLYQLESTLSTHNETFLGEQKKENLMEDIQSIKSTNMPNGDIYNDIIGILPDSKQLIMYATPEANQVRLTAQFKTLTDTAGYISELLKQNYITGAELTTVSLTNSVYEATFTITVDPENVVKEFGENE